MAVAVSGGKDSLALLDLLDRYRRTANMGYDLAAIHVRGDATGVTGLHLPLHDWLAATGLPYRIVEPELGERDTAAAGMPALHLAAAQGALLRRR